MGTRKQHRNIEVMGLMQGKTDGDAIIVMDAFALPVEGTETRVNAQADAYEYMVDYFQNNKQTPCGHNFCLKGFQKWVGLGKHTCENYRHAIPAKMASNPRINSSLVTAIRMAKMSKANGFVGPPKVHHFVHNQNRPDKAYTIDRAKKSGKANACSGKIFVTVPPVHFWPTSRKCSRQKTGYLSWGNLGGSVGMQAVGSSIFLMLQGYLDNQIMELSLWHSLVGMKMMRTMIESDNKVLSVYPLHAEFARPLWVFGMNSYEFIHSDEQKNLIGCSYRQNGRSYIGILDDSQSIISILDIPFTDINNIVISQNVHLFA